MTKVIVVIVYDRGDVCEDLTRVFAATPNGKVLAERFKLKLQQDGYTSYSTITPLWEK
jgi:hypothetical protein